MRFEPFKSIDEMHFTSKCAPSSLVLFSFRSFFFVLCASVFEFKDRFLLWFLELATVSERIQRHALKMLFALWSRSRFSFASRSMNTDCVWARASLFAHHLFRRRVDSMRCILFPSLFWSTQGTIRKNWFRLVRKIWKTIDKISWREQREKNQSKIWTLKNLNRFLAASSLSLSSMEMTCFGSISVCKPLEICFCICTFSNRNTHICYSATRQCTPKKTIQICGRFCSFISSLSSEVRSTFIIIPFILSLVHYSGLAFE